MNKEEAINFISNNLERAYTIASDNKFVDAVPLKLYFNYFKDEQGNYNISSKWDGNIDDFTNQLTEEQLIIIGRHLSLEVFK